MAIFKNTPPIVTNGLVLYLDAINPQSYTSGSTTWGNLTGNTNGGIYAVGGSPAAFPTSNNLSIAFSSSGDGGGNTATGSASTVIAYNSINISGSDPFTVTSTFYFRDYPPQRNYVDSANYVSLCMKGSYNPSWGLNIIYDLPTPTISGSFTRARLYYGIRNLTGTSGVTIGYGGLFNIAGSTNLQPNKWYQVTFTCQWNSILTRHETNLYINGILDSTSTYTPPSVGGISYPVNYFNTGPVNIANPSVLGGNGIYANINIGCNLIYNRVLSAQEVLQNYNATKTRFNLS